MKHLPYAFFGMITSFITASQLTQSISPEIMQQLINAVIAIISGLLTGLLSKLLHKWFIDVGKQEQLVNKDATINQLQNTINSMNQQKINWPPAPPVLKEKKD